MDIVRFTTQHYNIMNSIDFDKDIQIANIVWEKTFGNTYDVDECPSNTVFIGYNDKNEPIVAAIADIQYNDCMVSCVGSINEKKGNGSKLMKYIIQEIMNNQDIEKIYLNISYIYDENKMPKRNDKLYNFYKRLGFIEEKEDCYNMDKECKEQMSLFVK